MANYYYGMMVNRKDSLSHHGILGQKWGIRRYQNKDGTLTEEGKIRYYKSKEGQKELAENLKRNDTLEEISKYPQIQYAVKQMEKSVKKLVESSKHKDEELERVREIFDKAEDKSKYIDAVAQFIYTDKGYKDRSVDYNDYKKEFDKIYKEDNKRRAALDDTAYTLYLVRNHDKDTYSVISADMKLQYYVDILPMDARKYAKQLLGKYGNEKVEGDPGTTVRDALEYNILFNALYDTEYMPIYNPYSENYYKIELLKMKQ